MQMKSERLSEALSLNLSEQGYDHLTDVQSAVLAADPSSSDLFVLAPTGSGKTIAFGLAVAASLCSSTENAVAGKSAIVVSIVTIVK